MSKREPVAKLYAKALFELVKESGQLESVEKDFALLDETLKSSPNLREVLSAPLFSIDDRAKILETFTAKSELNAGLKRLLQLLLEKNRVALIEPIYESFQSILDASRNIVRGEVVTVEPLTDAENAELSQAFAKKLNKEVVLEPTIDKEILGGLIVKVQGRTFDGSLKTAMRRLKESLERQSI